MLAFLLQLISNLTKAEISMDITAKAHYEEVIYLFLYAIFKISRRSLL